jgi:Rrf2 family protein
MLSRTSEYALRALIYLTQHQDDWPITAQRIAQATGIPGKYLVKILGDLVRVGVLDATRGKHGGFRMTRPPKQTTLMEILAPFEVFHGRRCPFGNPICGDEDPCLAHNRWKQVIETEQRFLRRTSISDVAVPRDGVGGNGRRERRQRRRRRDV